MMPDYFGAILSLIVFIAIIGIFICFMCLRIQLHNEIMEVGKAKIITPNHRREYTSNSLLMRESEILEKEPLHRRNIRS